MRDLAFFLCGGLAMYMVAISMFRIYLRTMSERFRAKEAKLLKSKLEIEEKTVAVQRIIHSVYHEGPMPICKRIVGLARISVPSLNNLRMFLQLLLKPNHHNYAKLAIPEFEVLEDYFNKSKAQAEEMDEYLKKSVKKFEHLQ